MALPIIDNALLNKPLMNRNDSLEVFYFYIRKLINLSQTRQALQNPDIAPLYVFYTHQQAANKVFGNGQTDVVLITFMLDNFREYFEFNGGNDPQPFRPIIKKIEDEHPYCFKSRTQQSDIFSTLLEILASLGHERSALLNIQYKNCVDLQNLNSVTKKPNLYIYSANLVIDSDEMPSQFLEGIKVEYVCGAYKRLITILEHDLQHNQVIFQCTDDIPTHSPQIQTNSTFLLDRIRTKLQNFSADGNDFVRIYNAAFVLKQVNDNSDIWLTNVDESQGEAIQKALYQDISFIWGPPGTGKTHTLARLILNLCIRNEKTLVCCVANVAVDAITHKVVNILEEYKQANGTDLLKNGEIVRLGYSRDSELRKIDNLFPETEEVYVLREQINSIEEQLKTLKTNDVQKPILLAQRNELKQNLLDLVEARIANAKVVLCTITKALLEDIISMGQFDNVIIDEGSMVSPGIALGLLPMVKKRLIVAGDPKQLGPISLSNSGLSRQWLHSNLFDLLGDNLDIHPCVSILKKQRRSAPDIGAIVNTIFYNGILETVENERQKKQLQIPPCEGHICFCDIGQTQTYKVHYSASQSRYNEGSLTFVMNLLNRFRNTVSKGASIGIITPYRAQAGRYQEKIEKFIIDYKPRFYIKAGTIHSFQGSECDIILFDMVDALQDFQGNDMRIGNLYYNKQGEQLMNVAITRAISKLIVVGCSEVLTKGIRHGQVNDSLRKIINNLK